MYGRVVNDEFAPKNFSPPLNSVQHPTVDSSSIDEPLDRYVSRTIDGDEREISLRGREKQGDEHKRIQTCSDLSDEEKRILGLGSAETEGKC